MRSGSFTPARQALWFLVATSFATPSAQAGTSDLDAALEAWRAEHGASWLLDVDEKTGVGKLLYSGAAEPAFLPEHDASFVSVAIGFVADTEVLHGIDADMLVFDRIAFLPLSLIESTDKTTVRFQQQVEGVPVEGGYVNVLMDTEYGRLLSIQNTGLPGLGEFNTHPSISIDEATVLAREEFQRDTNLVPELFSTPALIIYQVEDETSRAPMLAWLVTARAWTNVSENERATSAYSYRFNANDGTLLHAENLTRHSGISGTVQSKVTDGIAALHDTQPVTTVPMASINIYNSLGSVIATTDGNGDFTIDGYATPLTVKLRYAGAATPRIQNDSGGSPNDEYELSFQLTGASGNNILMNGSPAETVTAQANAFYWITRTRDWLYEVNPADTVWTQFQSDEPEVHVNMSSRACNAGATVGQDSPHVPDELQFAIADGTECASNYCTEDVTCTNKSNSTIVVHELGHLLTAKYYGDNPDDPYFGEGVSDIFATYATNQPLFGADWCLGEMACQSRNATNSRRYCTNNLGNCYVNPYDNAEVLMGAFWKLRQRLMQSEGAGGGHVADMLFNSWMNAYVEDYIDPDIRTHILVLDDNSDPQGLSDGTPHWADIEYGFADQGFPLYYDPADGIEFSSVTDPVLTSDETGPYTISATIVANYAPPVASAKLFYRVNGGSFSQVSMSQSGGTDVFSASIPGQNSPAVVEYYIHATDSTDAGVGQTVRFPFTTKVAMDATDDQLDEDHSDGRNDEYDEDDATTIYGRFFIGTKTPRLSLQDFESPPYANWSHGGTQDDWQYGDPVQYDDGVWADPGQAHSGSYCAGNDLGLSGGNNEYEDEAANWLQSPSFALTNAGSGDRTFLRFWRWLSVRAWDNDDFLDTATVVLIGGSEDQTVWKNHRTLRHVDCADVTGSWVLVEIDITDAIAIGGSGTRRIEWRLESREGTNLLGGWTIDDVEVFTIQAVP